MDNLDKYDKREILYENELLYSVLSRHPESPGHALILPKEGVDLDRIMDSERMISRLNDAIDNTVQLIETVDLSFLYITAFKENFTDEIRHIIGRRRRNLTGFNYGLLENNRGWYILPHYER